MKLRSLTWLVSVLSIVITECKSESQDGIYVAKWENEYSIAEDTIEIKGDIVVKRTGYRKIRNGQIKSKEWNVKRWIYNDPGSPIIEPGSGHITLGNTFYKKIK